MKRKNQVKNLNIRLKALALAFMMTGTFALTGCSKKNSPSQDDAYKIVGTTDIDASKDKYDFIVFDVGNHEKRTKAEKIARKEDGIPVGIVISTEAETESEIYDDVEYARKLIYENDIDYPVFLNIEKIVKNKKLNNEMKEKLISDFLGKCSANGFYVGIYGKDSTLSLAKQYLEIGDYDAYVVMEGDEIEYTGTYHLFETQDGKIYSKGNVDLASVIEAKNLNTKERLVNDGKYVISKEEDLLRLSLEFNLSEEEILQYNDMKAKDIKAGVEIKIPSKINTVQGPNSNDTKAYEETDKLLRGCDISSNQTSIDWEQVCKNFDFIIIKSNEGETINSTYENNIEMANKMGIPVGTYCYNKPRITNCDKNIEKFKKDQNSQAQLAISALKNHDVTYPVYLDIEKSHDEDTRKTPWNEILPKDYAVSMINIWYEKITEAGYVPGVYFNGDTYKYFNGIFTSIEENLDSASNSERKFVDNWSNIQKWLAGGTQYDEPSDLSEIKEPSKAILESYPEINIFQVSEAARNAGAGNTAGYLDVNYSTVDYSKAKKVDNSESEEKTSQDTATEETGIEIKDFTKSDKAKLDEKAAKIINYINLGLIGCIPGMLLEKTILEEKQKQRCNKCNGEYAEKPKVYTRTREHVRRTKDEN